MAEAVNALVDSLAELVRSHPDLVLGLPTGRTMIPFYQELRDRASRGAINLGTVRAFNVDELVLPAGHPATFQQYMLQHAIPAAGIEISRWRIPESAASDPDTEARSYALELSRVGGLDAVILGLGSDGHVAYNLPGPPQETTHVATLPEELASRLAVPLEWRPLRAITLGLAELRGASRLFLLATTAEKAAAVRHLIQGGDPEQWPCCALTNHPALEVYLTVQAASLIDPSLGLLP